MGVTSAISVITQFSLGFVFRIVTYSCKDVGLFTAVLLMNQKQWWLTMKGQMLPILETEITVLLIGTSLQA